MYKRFCCLMKFNVLGWIGHTAVNCMFMNSSYSWKLCCALHISVSERYKWEIQSCCYLKYALRQVSLINMQISMLTMLTEHSSLLKGVESQKSGQSISHNAADKLIWLYVWGRQTFCKALYTVKLEWMRCCFFLKVHSSPFCMHESFTVLPPKH